MSKPAGLARSPLAWSVAAALTLGAAASAQAQEQPAVRQSAMEEISVTGTRIRRDDFSNPQPTTVVSSDMMESLGIVNVGDMMAQMPANVGSYTPTAKPGGNGGDNQSYPLNVFNGLNLANLRGLNPSYGTRTLTLVDSRRHVPTNQGDGVDLNMIPTVLIDRMEVVTGGASASYGSGAIAGVVNVLMDRDLEGVKAQMDFGQSDRGDGDDFHYGFAWGGAIGERGHLIAGIEGQKMDPIELCIHSGRDWCTRAVQIRPNPAHPNTPGPADPNNTLPHYVHVEGVRVDTTTAGVFPRLGLQFNQDGTALLPFDTADEFSRGGDGRHANAYMPIRSNLERTVFYSAYSHDLTDRLSLFIEGSYGEVESEAPQIPFDMAGDQIFHDNYYLNRLPGGNPCADLPITPSPGTGYPRSNCVFNKDFLEQSNTENNTKSETTRFVLGFNGGFGDTTWTWEAYYQYGKSDTLQAVYDSRYNERWKFGIDVVDDGNGNPICRVTRDGLEAYPWYRGDPVLAEGCVPINPFGTTNITEEAHAYGFGRIYENTYVRQDMLEFVASGDVWEGFGAGPVRAAAGFSWRDESIDNPSDPAQPDAIRRDYQSQFGESFGGSIEVWEYFGELDIPATQKASFQAAVRASEYTNSAGYGHVATGADGSEFDYNITTWKLNSTWDATDWLTLRASRSLDIRAPALRDLYHAKIFPGGSALAACSNPWTGNIFQGAFTGTGDPCTLNNFGSVTLRPEKAHTTTFGFMVRPQNASVRFAADYYEIDMRDAISPGGGSGSAINDCYEFRLPERCALINGILLDPNDPLGGFAEITETFTYNENNRLYQFSGVDLTADWVRDFAFGTISTRFLASHMIEQLIQPGVDNAVLVDISGVMGSMGGDWRAAPDWSGQLITSFARGPFALTLQGRYVSDGKIYRSDQRIGPEDPGYDPNIENSITTNRAPSYAIWGLNGSYNLNLRDVEMQVFGSIQNLFDRNPPLLGLGIGGTNPIFYDTVGRNFRLGVRLSF
jgi:iron complex outermembrane receptor protein